MGRSAGAHTDTHRQTGQWKTSKIPMLCSSSSKNDEEINIECSVWSYALFQGARLWERLPLNLMKKCKVCVEGEKQSINLYINVNTVIRSRDWCSAFDSIKEECRQHHKKIGNEQFTTTVYSVGLLDPTYGEQGEVFYCQPHMQPRQVVPLSPSRDDINVGLIIFLVSVHMIALC